MAKKKDVRTKKRLEQRKVRGWNTGLVDWVAMAQDHLDRLNKEAGKDQLELSPQEKARLTQLFLDRIDLYKEGALLSNTRLTRGEGLWAVKSDINYNQQLYKHTLPLTPEQYRNIRVHSFKYLIEIFYDRLGFPGYDQLKKECFDRPIPEEIPTSFPELEESYFRELQSFIQEIKDRKN